MNEKILYVPDMAKLLGITEAAVRGRIQRNSPAIPKWRTLHNRIVWTQDDYEAWDKSRHTLLAS